MRRSQDPYWLIAKYPGIDTDGKPFPKGARVFYYPRERKFLQGEKAEQASRDFQSACFDEAQYNGY